MNAAGLADSRRRRHSLLRRRRLILLLAGSLVVMLQSTPASLAVPATGISTPQPTRVERFDPDPEVCQPLAIKTTFARQLEPWADQPAAVIAQLRGVQMEMTRATLQRCVSKGLLQQAEASQLERELGLQPGSGSTPSPVPAAMPAGSRVSAPPSGR